MPRHGDDDPTVHVSRQKPGASAPQRRSTRSFALAVLLAVALPGFALVGAGAYWFWPRSPAGFVIPVASEAVIEADHPNGIAIFRFAPNPAVVVLDFASLATQGEMLNRLASFVEKQGLPHDHVLNDADLTQAIRARGETPETYYYGHDYRAADIARFFQTADQDHTALNAEEEWLRGLADRLGWLGVTPVGAVGALITLPRVNADAVVDAAARHTILHHELSHGEYFTNPAYAATAARFWNDDLTDAERRQFRAFLAHDGYDPNIEDLMINESQAYLMHTPDRRFFSEALVGLTPERLAELRSRFRHDMQPGWLRDETPAESQP